MSNVPRTAAMVGRAARPRLTVAYVSCIALTVLSSTLMRFAGAAEIEPE